MNTKVTRSSVEQSNYQCISEVQDKILQVPYCCQHVLAIQEQDQGSITLICKHDGMQLACFPQSDSIFRGHPACEECRQADYRFMIGLQGNLVQNWSRANLTYANLLDAMAFSQGIFMVRSMKHHSNIYGQMALTAEFVKHCEAEFWTTSIEHCKSGMRPLVHGMPPYVTRLAAANTLIRQRLPDVQLFVGALVDGVLLRILSDNDDPDGYVHVEWRAQSNRMQSYRRQQFPEYTTPHYYFQQLSRSSTPLAYIVTKTSQGIQFQPLETFLNSTWRENYQWLESQVGAGALPYVLNRDGKLEYPMFFLQGANGLGNTLS